MTIETFTQPKITGYRQLSEDEAVLMNDVKSLGLSIEGNIAMIESHLRTQQTEAGVEELERINKTEPKRWLAMARSDFQTALMKMTRAVAQPTSF